MIKVLYKKKHKSKKWNTKHFLGIALTSNKIMLPVCDRLGKIWGNTVPLLNFLNLDYFSKEMCRGITVGEW